MLIGLEVAHASCVSTFGDANAALARSVDRRELVRRILALFRCHDVNATRHLGHLFAGNQFNYSADKEIVEAPSLPRHKLADSVVVDCHGDSAGKSGQPVRQLRLAGGKLAIALEATYSSRSSDGPGILPTRRRIVRRGSPLLG